MTMSKEKYVPQVGDSVKPDGWNHHEALEADSGFRDSSFPGCQFRVPAGGYKSDNITPMFKLAVNVSVTGKPHNDPLYHLGHPFHMFRSRCKIEFVGDDEPSEFTHGWIYHKNISGLA